MPGKRRERRKKNQKNQNTTPKTNQLCKWRRKDAKEQRAPSPGPAGAGGARLPRGAPGKPPPRRGGQAAMEAPVASPSPPALRPPGPGLGRSLLRGGLRGDFCPTETSLFAAPASGPSPAAPRPAAPTHLAALPARPAPPHRGEPSRTGANRTAPRGTAPDRAAPRSTEPSRNLPSRAERERYRYRSGASGAVPAARLAGRRGARQSPARAGPVPAGNPSPSRPDWKSPAGCAGWAGPGLLSVTVMRRQIWAGAGPRQPPPRPRSRPGDAPGLRGKRLALNGAQSERHRAPGPAGGRRDRYGTGPTRWSGTGPGGRFPMLDPGPTRWSGTSPGGRSPHA